MREHVSGRRRVAVGLAAMAVGAIGLVGAFPSAAGATGDDDNLPFEHPCPGEGYYFQWGHEPPRDQNAIAGTHTQDDATIAADGDFSVTISGVEVVDGHKSFDFVSSVPVSAVFVMGNPRSDPEGNLYEYETPVTEGSDLESGDQWVKNVVFCPVPEQETTTTTEATTTTTEATTTTTVEETTTTTAPPTSETTVTTPPTSVEDTTPTTETTVPPTTVPVGEELPETGSTTMPLVAGAAALVAVGVAAVAGRRFLQNRAAS